MNTLQMAGHLAISRIRNARGHALLDTLAVVAFSVSSWLLLTTMGGVWMFYGRLGQLSARLEHLYGIPAHYTENMDRAHGAGTVGARPAHYSAAVLGRFRGSSRHQR
ncbi:hypothetical protein QEU98_02660 [Trueperella pyogenes]|uniref:hypothetical protein n=1 Tax=Trueperella pyogenes TaxID=1661 RepID=UPI003256692B